MIEGEGLKAIKNAMDRIDRASAGGQTYPRAVRSLRQRSHCKPRRARSGLSGRYACVE